MIVTARIIESFNVTPTTFFALSTFPAPNSFTTRVLQKKKIYNSIKLEECIILFIESLGASGYAYLTAALNP